MTDGTQKPELRCRHDHCDICGTELLKTRDVDEGRILEAEDKCPNGCYEYVFAYGAILKRIGEFSWHYDYSEIGQEQYKRQQEEGEALIQARQKLWSKANGRL